MAYVEHNSNEDYIQVNYYSSTLNAEIGDKFLCDRFSYSATAGSSNLDCGIKIYEAGIVVFCVPTTIATTLDEFKTWLSNNPITFYYATTKSQIISLGTVKLPTAFKNISHIYLADDLNPNLTVTYIKDFETLLGGIANGS